METPKTRGRPRSFDRQAAIEQAMMVFWKHGYEGTSIADLTNAMGFTPPTLYAAFGSKEQLYRDVLEHYATQGSQATLQELGDDISAYELIEQYLRKMAVSFSDPAKPAGCMISTASLYCATENQSAQAIAASFRSGMLNLAISKFTKAQERGELPSDADILSLARFYSAVGQGMSVQAIDGASTAELLRMVDVAMLAWPGKRS